MCFVGLCEDLWLLFCRVERLEWVGGWVPFSFERGGGVWFGGGGEAVGCLLISTPCSEGGCVVSDLWLFLVGECLSAYQYRLCSLFSLLLERWCM